MSINGTHAADNVCGDMYAEKDMGLSSAMPVRLACFVVVTSQYCCFGFNFGFGSDSRSILDGAVCLSHG